MTVSTYLSTKLDTIAGELTRGGVGAETLARHYTTFLDCLYKDGKIDQRIVVPRSKIESTRKRDGDKRLKDLSNRKPVGKFNYFSTV